VQDLINFLPLNSDLYRDFYLKTQQIDFGPILLPSVYIDSLWGILAVVEENLIGGWVGQLRGDIPFARHFSRGVWFDSLPIIFKVQENETLFFKLINMAISKAKTDGIVLFNITHWSRQMLSQRNIFYHTEIHGTYILSLKKEIDTLWKDTDSALRNKVRKGEKNEVDVTILKGIDAIPYIDIFRQLREKTQERALDKNSKTSMLLKSGYFYKSILQYCHSFFFIAKHKNEIVAMALMIKRGRIMYYYSVRRELQTNNKVAAASFLIWKAICFSKDLGIEYFDLGGVPVMPGKDHPAYGVYEFKKSFGGEYKEYCSGRIVINKLKFSILNIVLKNQAILRKISKKE